MQDLVCAVDVGTTSARAGLFDRGGGMVSRTVAPIRTNRPQRNHVEQDSENIWAAVCQAVRAAIAEAGVSGDAVAALSFDATCSLVVRAADGSPVSISQNGEAHWDTIVWIDHRAIAEAGDCTATADPVLAYHGGTMSPEMQVPKLMWLKRNFPESWAKEHCFFDLADFLTWRASGSATRSLCTLTSKWSYLPDAGGWPRDFYDRLGIADVLASPGLDQEPQPVGTALGTVLADRAEELGVSSRCNVGAGMIDAFAGALGSIDSPGGRALQTRAALISGTSSCIMCLEKTKRSVDGVWGPYLGAIFDGLWVSEAGQSAAGAALDSVIRMCDDSGQVGYARHAEILDRIADMGAAGPYKIGRHIHVLPDFHGCRSPIADTQARAVISGLSLDRSFDTLCALYWRTAVANALGIRQIIGHLTDHGHEIEALSMAGGHARSPLLVELYADVTGLDIFASTTKDTTLLGTAMSAAVAAGWYGDLTTSCEQMGQPTTRQEPCPAARSAYDRDFAVFLRMQQHRQEVTKLEEQ